MAEAGEEYGVLALTREYVRLFRRNSEGADPPAFTLDEVRTLQRLLGADDPDPERRRTRFRELKDALGLFFHEDGSQSAHFYRRRGYSIEALEKNIRSLLMQRADILRADRERRP
jgi:hypothetical protein